jgi:putative toxin-antitoxin system antitoxin component (TIGR02293 family)
MAILKRKRFRKSLALQAVARRKFAVVHTGSGKSHRYLWKPQGLKQLRTHTFKLTAPTGRICKTCLGLRMRNKAQVIAALKAGLPVGSFNRLQGALAIPAQELAGIVQIPVRTLARRQKEKHLDIDESERVLRIGSLFDRAVSVLGDEDQARQWLKSPQRALGGHTPLEYADTEPGAREVEDLLGRLEYGVFA